MKKNQLNETKGLSVKELLEKTVVLKKEIADAVMDKNMNKLKDLKTISKKRKDLAQTMTLIRQKEMLGQLEAKASVKEVAKEEIKATTEKVKKIKVSKKGSA